MPYLYRLNTNEIMTSKIFYGSRLRMMRVAQEVLKDMNISKKMVDSQSNIIHAEHKRGLFRIPKDVEIIMYADDSRVEVAINVESSIKALDFGTSQYMEEEFLVRLKERVQ